MVQSGASSNIPAFHVFDFSCCNEIERLSVPDLIEELDYDDHDPTAAPNISVPSATIGYAPYQDPVPRGMGRSPFPLNGVIDSSPGNRSNGPNPGLKQGIRVVIGSGHEFDPKNIDTSIVRSWSDIRNVLKAKIATLTECMTGCFDEVFPGAVLAVETRTRQRRISLAILRNGFTDDSKLYVDRYALLVDLRLFSEW